jgi:hypothetical protein
MILRLQWITDVSGNGSKKGLKDSEFEVHGKGKDKGKYVSG